MPRSSITLPAFAKINLSLRIIGRRADGYHELDTVLQAISLHDTISFASSDDGQIVLWCDDRSLATDATNLVSRAANELRSRYAVTKGAVIRLEKRIPTQGGLGGGSADAAATLLGLSHLWETGAPPKELVEIAKGLGADVPFFFYGGTARASGIGTEVTALPEASEETLLVLKPNASVATVQAYQALNSPSLTSFSSQTILSSSPTQRDRNHIADRARANDFESVVIGLEPEIGRAKAALMKAGAESALLAGSGSAVFGIFDNQQAQARAIQAIELETGWRVFPCTTVGRDQYRRAMGPSGAMLVSVPDDMNAGA